VKSLPPATACGILDTIAAGRKYIPDPMEYLATAETTYKGAYRIDSDRDLPAYCKRIQRCHITPTAFLLMTPSIDVTNRVIRHFIRYLDRFLRVTCTFPSSAPCLNLPSFSPRTRSCFWVLMIVTDEDQQKIQSSADRKQLDEVYTRVYRTLKNGITVGGRHFEFLAFGNSQLRDHGCYMFNSNEHLTADMIREWMGIFDGIKSVAKYAGIPTPSWQLFEVLTVARLGQCFSTTRPGILIFERG
jgi:RNA-dependent RNA polymerase